MTRRTEAWKWNRSETGFGKYRGNVHCLQLSAGHEVVPTCEWGEGVAEWCGEIGTDGAHVRRKPDQR